MQNSLSPIMLTLMNEYNMVGFLTSELLQRHDENPKLDRFVGYSPTSYKIALEKLFPTNSKSLFAGNNSSFSFYRELKHVPDILHCTPKQYPALMAHWNKHVECILSLEYCRIMFPKIEHNANALRELSELLTAHSQQVWFVVPPSKQSTEEIQRKAVLRALAKLAEENPRKFPALVKELVHEMGYDKKKIGNKDIASLLEKMVSE